MTVRTNSRLAGFTFLFYIAIGLTQMVVGSAITGASGTAARLALMAQHAPQVRIDIALTLLMCVTAFSLAVALYALTRDVDRDLALLGLAFRLGEGMFAALAPMVALAQLWLAKSVAVAGAPDAASSNVLGAYLFKLGGWNATLSATLFAFGSLLFCSLLLRGRRIPVPLAWLGVAASVLLVVCLPLNLLGLLRGLAAQLIWLPMAAFEIPLGVWLLVKGVRVPEAA